MSKMQSLSQNIQTLTKKLQKKQIDRKEKKIKKREQLNDLYDAIQQKSNMVVSKIQDLNRKPTVIVWVSKIVPQIPQGFPKNYNVQIVYEDITVTGNQKFLDFDENIIDERFILPLLSSEQAKLEVWIAEQQLSVYDRSIINLQADIEAALQDPDYSNQIAFETNSSLSVSYKVQLQGIGFQAWLKNIKSIRQAEQQRRKARKQTQIKINKTKQMIQQKKAKFNNKFNKVETNSAKTKEYNLKGIDQILNILDD